MAIDALADVTASGPPQGRPMRRLVCACGATYSAQSRPDPVLLDPWATAHAAHDDGLTARAEVTW